MDTIHSTEWMLLIGMMAHIVMVPFTKVEESFNVQAMHDILYHRLNISAYDHLKFPGIVPRTFIGAIAVSSVLLPFIKCFEWFEVSKYWVLFAVRFALGAVVVVSFCNFARCVQKHFGCQTAIFLRLIVLSQFHFLFYCTRPLPNTFALAGVLYVYQLWMENSFTRAFRAATALTVLFRCELSLLFASLFIEPILRKRLPILGYRGVIWSGLMALSMTLALTIPIDSFLWRRFVWPEGEVAFFNVIQNRSHEYGIKPLLWYFYSVLPRALLSSIFFVPFGLIFDKKLRSVVLPIIVFILLYSVLPHKELRFIIYGLPILNLSAAVLCSKLWLARKKLLLRYVISFAIVLHLIVNALITMVFIYASSNNYPGGDAFAYLQVMQRFDRNKPLTVYIDNFSAQTGVNRFVQFYPKWEYNKTENLNLDELKRFDFLLLGSYAGKNIVEVAVGNFSTTHRLLYSVSAYQKIRFKKSYKFPYYWPVMKFKNCLAVLVKLNHK